MKRHEFIIDGFAGGGGTSLGIEWALGRSPHFAVNHDEEAVIMHEANHPRTKHARADIREVPIRSLTKGRNVGLLWLSPDCTYHSRARGSKPFRESGKKIRSLAWVACDWAAKIKPRVIIVENVSELEQWGPVVPKLECRSCEWRGTEGQARLARTRHRCPQCNSDRLSETGDLVPDPERKGMTFKRWVSRLRNLGYEVQWRILNAADYGSPTNRRRLFVIARRDGEFIYWPTPTHASPAKIATLADFKGCQPYRTAAECIDWSIPCPSIFDRESQGKKPLVEKTMRRIAMGIKRYVIDAKQPFIVPLTHSGDRRSHPMDEPMPTITGANRGEHALCVPILSQYHHGKTATDSRCGAVDSPINTLDTQPRYALVSAFIAKHFGGQVGSQIERPLPTTTSRGTQNQIVAATLVRQFGNSIGQPIDTPSPTQTSGSKSQLVAANLIHMNHGEKQWSGVDEPNRTLTTGRHAALVYSFLTKYFGTAIGQPVDEPLHTVTGKARFGVVTVEIDGQTYAIVDIGMRMLTPRELARCQGFPDSYVLTGTKTNQIAKIGNSVPPHVAAAIIRANLGPASDRKTVDGSKLSGAKM